MSKMRRNNDMMVCRLITVIDIRVFQLDARVRSGVI